MLTTATPPVFGAAVSNRSGPPHLSPAERRILEGLGNSPWKKSNLTPASVKAARQAWGRLRSAAGFTSVGGWLTTDATNPKMGKAALPSIGVTVHSAQLARDAWDELDPLRQFRLAAAVGVSVADVRAALGNTVCPCSTPGCREACVTARSVNSMPPVTQLSRLTRTLLTMFQPEAAVVLTATALRSLSGRYGRRCRWRVNISDDLRWELLAPGLFRFGVPAYTYTKWSPERRPGRQGLSIVYSATERTSVAWIRKVTGDGLRVAVVFDVKPGDLPRTWNGVDVVDGDRTDDLWTHPTGKIVGLCRKGPNSAMFESMRACGFARPV